ncbi:hypothetical protein F3Y22_tig00110551pilonHSYRG00122 [Hibiscus syriacus]|uniref:Uncharacterized protein n=1 Tax=Hibiscus syriacus TaxID=106335 RepID=A0A6A3A936_HIBSY|nr:hypothetical protein F3Y22_tig00110551pilonHSYRG00122 [Hibiscus syriacus]
MMPIKSQFDSLIREGSLEWRSLCENESYRDGSLTSTLIPRRFSKQKFNGKEGSVAGAEVVKPEKSIESEDSGRYQEGFNGINTATSPTTDEFQYTEFLQPLPETCASTMTAATKTTAATPLTVEGPVN